MQILGRRIWLPPHAALRLPLGGLLVAGGLLGFLPVLGFWMVPLGVAVLAVDVPVADRLRRRTAIWLRRQGRRWRRWKQRP